MRMTARRSLRIEPTIGTFCGQALRIALVALGISSFACTGIVDGNKSSPRGNSANNGDSKGNGPNGENPGGNMADPPGIEGIGWTTRFPRLSHTQWENTVRDLLRLDSLPNLASTFTTDPTARFDTYAAKNTVSANLWGDYQRAAETVAKTVAQDPAKRERIVPQGADAEQFVTEFGKRAYRRPLSQEEVDRYVGLFNQGQQLLGGDAFASGVELVLRAFLQSVHFLYRVESSTAAKDKKIWLNGYEIATRLSYALWNSMPSDELLEAAAGTELTTPTGLEKWTKSALDDPRAAQVLVGFHSQLFHVELLGTTEKSKSMFPNFSTELAPVLQNEARRFFEEITVKQNGGIGALISTPVAFVNEDTAPFYGVSVSGSDLQRVELDPAKRAGFLTHIGFLSHYSTQTQSDPIRRGATIYTEILCEELIQPNNVPALPPQKTGETNRERVAASTSEQPCNSCHEPYINPLGFAFENYDAVGAWRDQDNGKPIDASSTFELDGQEVSYGNAVELSNLLAKSPMVHSCYSKNLLGYILGRNVASEEEGTLERVADVSTSGATMKDLLSNITALETFRARPEETK